MKKYKLVEWKKASEGEPTSDINKLIKIQEALNRETRSEGLNYTIEEVFGRD